MDLPTIADDNGRQLFKDAQEKDTHIKKYFVLISFFRVTSVNPQSLRSLFSIASWRLVNSVPPQ